MLCQSASRVYTDEEVVTALGKLGYSASLAEKRREIYDCIAKGSTLVYKAKSDENVRLMIGGSRGEGLGCFFDTDLDKVLIQKSVICLEKGEACSGTEIYCAKFELDTNEVPNGYARLRLREFNENSSEGDYFKSHIKSALVDKNGVRYLRNDDILTKGFSRETVWKTDGWITSRMKFSENKQGPSKPFSARIPFTNLSLMVDDVLAFPFRCVTLTRNWCERVRIREWPSSETIDNIKTLEAFVVPVGKKGHAEERLLWRISFNLAERELIKSFSDIQIKTYVAVKMIFKHELKPICEKVTSYMAKNVVFWFLENSGCPDNEENIFGKRLLDAIGLFLRFLENGNLPNYLIPERNMLDHLIDEERDKLSKRTRQLLGLGNGCLRRCPEIRKLIGVPEKRSKKIIFKRELWEQMIMAIFVIEPSEYLDAQKEFFEAKSPEEVLFVIKSRSLDPLRRDDRFGFFHHIRDKTDIELINSFFRGLTRAYVRRVYRRMQSNKKFSSICQDHSVEILN